MKNKSNGKLEFLKVINTCRLGDKNVKKTMVRLETINKNGFENLMKYSKLILYKNEFYRLMPYMRINLGKVDPVSYFEDSGVYEVLCEILSGLKSLHSIDMYHGDLKPSNIFLTEENSVKLNDYLNNDIYKGKEGEKVGKNDDICFSNYEEIAGLEVSKESDIWSFGCVFYYIISGKLLFKDISLLKTIKNIENCKYLKMDCDFKKEFNQLLKKLIVKEKSSRLSIDEILKKLKEINSTLYIGDTVNADDDEDDIKVDGLDCAIRIYIFIYIYL